MNLTRYRRAGAASRREGGMVADPNGAFVRYDDIARIAQINREAAHAESSADLEPTPIPMVIHCPECGAQHIDKPDPEKQWDNPPHRSHWCHGCGHVWRPCDLPTVGVEAVTTKGKDDGKILKKKAPSDEPAEQQQPE